MVWSLHVWNKMNEWHQPGKNIFTVVFFSLISQYDLSKKSSTNHWMFFPTLTMTYFVFKICTAWVQLDIYSSGYVAEIYDILITTPREDLNILKDELTAQVPEPLHSLLKDKESKAEAKEKYLSRKKRETVICPPTCSGTVHSQHRLVWNKTCGRKNETESCHSNHIEFIVLIIQHNNPQALATGSFWRPWVHISYPITQYNTIQALMDRAIRCFKDLGKRM